MPVATARQGDFFIAVSAAVALHGVAFGALVLLALAEILIDSNREKPVPRPVEPEAAIVELGPDYFQGLPAQPDPVRPLAPDAVVVVEPPPSEGKAFLSTDPSQASDTPPPEAAFIGERDTRAASEGEAVANAPPVPSQDGEKRLRDDLNLFDSSFNDGEDPGEKTSNELEPEKLAGTPVDPKDREAEPTEPELAQEKEGGRPKDVLLNSEDVVPVPAEDGKTAKVKEEKLPREKQNPSVAEAARKGEDGKAKVTPEEQLKKSGFKTESRKTQIRGSLNRRGQSALDVENTAVGRYRAKVYRVIEREWQKQCITYRNHILPGSLTLRFFVDQGGNVSSLRYIYEFQTSEIQKGFSVMSVRRANLPPMPKDVRQELDGEPMECELDLNFRF